MKTMMMITIAVLMTMTMAKSDETIDVKVKNYIVNEVSKTKEYQTKVWADQKVKNAEMWSKLKSLFKGNNDS
jgi:hypothetical protein